MSARTTPPEPGKPYEFQHAMDGIHWTVEKRGSLKRMTEMMAREEVANLRRHIRTLKCRVVERATGKTVVSL
ncbi:MAG: hypothetical protein KGJ23_07820 [Euryarchaeota archaeon]|nr:hypothetical protein [Euryarchaeota archaeon]MDE1836507.1 hypothetical protein [Euryarchaeota archaeon]MDE1879298.1 hypothetical protein [Euryarchaeota archaeon]MDE2044477.1 hypothetical protein [Thermoplasmata archaeon]